VQAPIVINCARTWAGLVDARASVPVRPAKGQLLVVDRGALRLSHLIGGVRGSAVPRADGQTLVAATTHDMGFDKDVIAATASVASHAPSGCCLVSPRADLSVPGPGVGRCPPIDDQSLVSIH